MKNMIADIKTAVNTFGAIREGRKRGQEVRPKHVIVIPLFTVGGSFYDTTEGCAIARCGREINDLVQGAFIELPSEVKSKLTYLPEEGEFIERVRFWRKLLRPVLSPKQYHKAMYAVIENYVHIKNLR